jgi:CubicO group peptidase (beta-lactamase class C family)
MSNSQSSALTLERDFQVVADAFNANFAERGEVGAAICVIKDGRVVLDMFGGWRSAARSDQWREDTLVNVWSTTKGVSAGCFAMLVDAGRCCYADRVARYWPEFAAGGKEGITIAQLLSHQAGLCGFTSPSTIDDLLAGKLAAARLASQAPIWALDGSTGYHAITGGILATELFSRIEGRSMREFVAEELRSKRGFDISIGLEPQDETRRAELIAPPEMDSTQIASLSDAQIAALGNPPLDPLIPNQAKWRAADLPSANGHSNARAIAHFYAALIGQGPGERLIRPETLAQATTQLAEGTDRVLAVHSRWGAGFLLNAQGVYGPSDTAFGHSGWGGSFGMADPANGLAISYTMNRMGADLRNDPRNAALIAAVYTAIG